MSSNSAAIRRSMIIEANDDHDDGDRDEAESKQAQEMKQTAEERDESTAMMMMMAARPRDLSGAELRKLERPKTAMVGDAARHRRRPHYRHMFYSGTWPRVHSELYTGEIDRLAPADRNVVMFQDVRKKLPETFIFHPEWV